MPTQNEQGNDLETYITDVANSDVERQSIGNCWIYALAGWTESLHLRATDVELDLSQSYLTYMHWFDQIVAGSDTIDEISTGGSWAKGKSLMLQYGWMPEDEFVPLDDADEMAEIQSAALHEINAALSKDTGTLNTPEKRADREQVKKALDDAFALSETVRDYLDKTFGPGLEKDFTGYGGQRADASGTPIINPRELQVKYTYGPRYRYTKKEDQTLYDALYDWDDTRFALTSRSQLKRIQMALHAEEPAILSWYVIFDALESKGDMRGSFNLQTLENIEDPDIDGTGFHMTVLEDYEAILRGIDTQEFPSISVPSDEFVAMDPIEVADGKITVTLSPSNDNPTDGEGAPMGDVDLFVSMGEQPTRNRADCSGEKWGSTESCTVSGTGPLYIALYGYPTSDSDPVEASVNVKVTMPSGETQILKAGVTLNPDIPEEKNLLDAALEPSAKIRFFRVKNSWGGEGRPSLATAPGPINREDGTLEMGFHDLYMDYLSSNEAMEDYYCQKENSRCNSSTTPMTDILLPPGY